MKTCSKCKLSKKASEFNKQKRNKDGLNFQCRKCQNQWQREHYKKSERRKKQVRKNDKAAVQRTRTFIAEYLKNHPCIDCGYSNILALEFDHLRDKKFEIADKISTAISKEKIQQEINKCEVVCSNCHKIRTSDRMGGNWKAKYMTV